MSLPTVRRFSITVRLTGGSQQLQWWLMNIYGPVALSEKSAFLQELRDVRAACPGPWLVCGDFNLIYQAADKNNGRLNRGLMRAFWDVIDSLQLDELHLNGRLYTWSSGREVPTLERIDRAFGSVQWMQAFPNHHLRSLSSDSSDHVPLLLVLNSQPWAVPRFRFEQFWTKVNGFLDVVSEGWGQTNVTIDACKDVDIKLRALAKSLSSWRATHVGNVAFQLAAARAIIYEFDVAQESRQMSAGERELHQDLKAHVLGLASLARTMARQRARTRQLRDGDACTKFFHLQACHRRRKNYMLAIAHNGVTFTEDDAKEEVIYDYYNAILGTAFVRSHCIVLDQLQLPRLDLDDLACPFTKEEIARAVKDSPSDRAPGPDGFGAGFLKAAWSVVGDDIARAFQQLWELDFRNCNRLNEAIMVLLHKSSSPQGLRDYRPISLIHCIGKLFAKTLAICLQPYMHQLIAINQTAFIRGRRIHDNFRTVQLACRWLHSKRHPMLLLKVDLAKAFDTVSWPFLLEVLEHMDFPRRWREWVSYMLSTATTKVLINGRPGRRIYHARGLRQGDPLSPSLFVIVMEVLNALIAEADRRGQLTALPGCSIKFRTSVYADDLVILLAPKAIDFVCIRRILDLFAGASGLATNVDKCTVTPIRCSEEALAEVLQAFPCRVQPFPAKYLGAPLSIKRLTRAEEQAFVDSVASRIPAWKGSLMNHVGRTTLASSTLSAIPVHVSICCALSPWALKEIDKR